MITDNLISDANKHQVIAINKLHRSFQRIFEKAKLNNAEVYLLADQIGVPRGLLRALKVDSLDDMTLTDYFRIRELLYSTSILDIHQMVGRDDSTDEDLNESEDREFLIELNKNLPEDSQIDEDEALEAKDVFDQDVENEEDDEPEIDIDMIFNGMPVEFDPNNLKEFKETLLKKINEFCDNPKDEMQKLKEKTKADYDKAVKDAQMKLFGDTEMLDNKTIGELKYYIYKNRWDKEFDLDMINHRQTVLLFLYRKLQDETEKNLKVIKNITEKDEKNLNNVRRVAQKYSKKNMAKETNKPTNTNRPTTKKSNNLMDDINSIFDLLNKFGLKGNA